MDTAAHEGWRDLIDTRGRFAGQLARRRFKPSGALVPDGNPTPIRRHHPTTPERSRPLRFQVRGEAAKGTTEPGELPPVATAW